MLACRQPGICAGGLSGANPDLTFAIMQEDELAEKLAAAHVSAPDWIPGKPPAVQTAPASAAKAKPAAPEPQPPAEEGVRTGGFLRKASIGCSATAVKKKRF